MQMCKTFNGNKKCFSERVDINRGINFLKYWKIQNRKDVILSNVSTDLRFEI